MCENGTGGDAADQIQRAINKNGWNSWVNLIVLHLNRGFTGGTNAAIRPAMESDDPPQYVLLLNADTIVTDESIKPLIDFMDRNQKVGIAASMLLSPNGEVQASPFRFPGIASEFDWGLRWGFVSKLLSRWAVVFPTPTEACKVDWAAGASLMLRRTMLDQIGLLDEGLYTYFDDIDICLRALRAGWETWYVPASKVIHLEGASTGVATRLATRRRPSYWFQARHRFFTKNYGAFYTAMADAAFITGHVLWRLRRWIQRKPNTDPPHMLMDAIRHSVFWLGPKVRVVENPALTHAPQHV